MRAKYSAALGTQICDLIRGGAFVSTAAKSVGVARDTIYDWLRRGEANPPAHGDDAYVAFAELFRAAEAEAELAVMRELRSPKLSAPQAKALTWFAEKRWPTRFGSRVALEHSGPGGGPIEAAVAARVVVLPPITDAADLADDSVDADAEAGALSREPRE